jgi:3-dehydroquinate synthase
MSMYILKASDYQIEIGSLEASGFSDFIQQYYTDSKIVIIVDENTNDNCLEYLITTFDFLAEAEVILLPSGEENKVMEVCFQVWEALSEYRVGRRDLIINLGGGVVTDMGGFIASIFKRGIDFIHIPTTLLGMVDASIGGKTGIDLGMYKNQLGVFRNPKAIYIDKIFLGTLEPRDFVNGFAEVIKHALIQDLDLWKQLTELDNLSEISTDEMLNRIISIKLNVVNQDPLEAGLRKVLNFGHTAGHAIEGYFLFKEPVEHGHAVALGIITESYISMRLGKLTQAEFVEIEQMILAWFPIPQITMGDIKGIVELLYNDKKNHSGKIQCCLLDKIGNCIYNQTVEESTFIDAFVYLMSKSVPLN